MPIPVRLVWLILAYPNTETPSQIVFAAAAHSTATTEADTTLTDATRTGQSPVVIRDLLFGALGGSLNIHAPYPRLGKFSYQRVSEGSM